MPRSNVEDTTKQERCFSTINVNNFFCFSDQPGPKRRRIMSTEPSDTESNSEHHELKSKFRFHENVLPIDRF